MTRVVLFLFSGWTALFAPVLACSRNEDPVKGTAAAPRATDPSPVQSSGHVYRYLALGDSYTVGTAIDASGAYPFQTVAQLKATGIDFSVPLVIATNGWTTENLLSALADTMGSGISGTYDVVTLLIGVNNQYQGGTVDEYKPEFSRLLDKSIALAGNRPTHVIVLSIPDYGVSPFGLGQHRGGVSAGIDDFNQANKSIADARGVRYLNVTDYTRMTGGNKDLFAPDGLHYSSAEYAIWAGDLAKLFRQAIGE